MASTSTIVRERCVVLIAKSGAGKSTVANQIVGHDPLSPHDPPFEVSQQVLQSVTREVKHELVEFTSGGILYRVRVIDTVGLFDTQIAGQDPIFDKISDYFRDYEIPGINLILFVFKKGRFTAEEKEVFRFVREKFQQEVAPISALAVTGCENDNANQRDQFVRQFKEDRQTSGIAQQMKMGIHPVGFPPLKEMMEMLHPVYRPIMETDRQTLRDLVISAESPHLTKKLFDEKVKPWACTIL